MLLTSDTQLNQKSYYEASVQRGPALAALSGSTRADVLVVGGGYSGLTAALDLAGRGFSVVLLEAERLCGGASGRNGGQTIVGYASGQEELERQLGAADARRAWDWSLEAIRLVDERVAQHAIECDRVHGYLYVADSPRKAKTLLAEMDRARESYGFETDVVTGAAVRELIDSPLYQAAAYDRTSGHLHPLKYGLGLARAAQAAGVRMYEHSPVLSLSRGQPAVARTAQGQVSAKFVVLAGNCTLAEHGPQVAPEAVSRIMPVGTYIIATQALDPALCQRLVPSHAATCDNNFVLDYFRFSADHRLLFGGRVSYSTMTPPDLLGVMQRRMVKVFPQLAGTAVDYVWGGFVDISMNRAPDFGRLEPHIYYLQGFSGHGVALTGLAGRLVADAVAGQAERFDVFARLKHRPFPGGPWLRMPTLAVGMLYHRLRDLL